MSGTISIHRRLTHRGTVPRLRAGQGGLRPQVAVPAALLLTAGIVMLIGFVVDRLA